MPPITTTLRGALAALAAVVLLPAAAHAGSIHDFVIYGVDSVIIGHSTQILSGDVGGETKVNFASGVKVNGDVHSGGSVLTRKNEITGSIFAAGDVKVGNVTLHGDIHSGGDVTTIAHGATVMGTITQNPGSDFHFGSTSSHGGHSFGSPTAPMLPGLPGASVFSSGGAGVVTGSSTTTNLSTGSHGAVELGVGNTLVLTAGTYFLDSFHMKSGGEIVYDVTDGEIKVYVTGDWKVGSGLDVQVIGGLANQIFTEVHGDFREAGGASVVGGVFAPFGLIKLGSGGSKFDVDGFLWGREVRLEHNGALVHNPVPEPSAIALFSVGLVALGLGARRRLTDNA